MTINRIPEISVIIPAYNVEGYIGACIQSCLEQDLKNFEIIVINDGSKDNTLSIIRKYADKDDRINVIDKSNGGVTSARQSGLDISKAEYIFFLDGDDRLCQPSALSMLLRKAKTCNADYVAGNFIIVYPDGSTFDRRFPIHGSFDSKQALSYAFLNNDFYYTGRLLRRALANKVNRQIPSDITYGEDTYAIVKFLSLITLSERIDEPVLQYVQRETSVTNRLSKYDLEKRNKAINMTIQLSEKLGFEKFAKFEITVYALRELAQSILMGIPNRNISKKYLSSSFLLSTKCKKYLGGKSRTILLSSKISLTLTCLVVKLLKRIR